MKGDRLCCSAVKCGGKAREEKEQVELRCAKHDRDAVASLKNWRSKRDAHPPAIGPAQRVIPKLFSITVTVCRSSFSSFELLLCTRKRKGSFARGLLRFPLVSHQPFASPRPPKPRSSQLSTTALATQRGGSTCHYPKGPEEWPREKHRLQ